ncbi:putative F-box domain-containing protein [Tanacetum coccineum]
MSDNIPFDIQAEIMKRLPVKSLIQFRLVSKLWKSLIDSSAFIAEYQRTELQQHILVRDGIGPKYVSIADDDTFPHQKVPLTVPMSIKTLGRPGIIGCSQGLFCLFDEFGKPTDSGKKTAVIWNPTIRKSVAINMPAPSYQTYQIVGFGVCPDTLDPILVNMLWDKSETTPTWIVDVFKLSWGVWKSLSVNLPGRTIVTLNTERVAIDKFIYFHASDWSSCSDLILSFDMISEEFTEIRLPGTLAINYNMQTGICKFGESLIVHQSEREVDEPEYGIWMMENGDPVSFKKIFTIKSNLPANTSISGVFGSRKSGEVLIYVKKCLEEEEYELWVYDPNSEHIDYISTFARYYSFFVSSYTETLLLLDR